MHRLVSLLRSTLCFLVLGITGITPASVLPSGFTDSPSPAEQELAASPQPDRQFREFTALWIGYPGINALRQRWNSFAADHSGFAVLAALLAEADGHPQDTLASLRIMDGDDARWNHARLCALLGHEQEATTILSSLVSSAERPAIAAAALLALTELDCLRGNFAAALTRTSSAWSSRPQPDFRQRILERHVSLLVDAGKESAFLDEQHALASANDNSPASISARHTMAVLADWFTADPRTEAFRASLAPSLVSTLATPVLVTNPDNIQPRPTHTCGFLKPVGTELDRLARDPSPLSLENAGYFALHLATSRQWPPDLSALPAFQKTFNSHPLELARLLFISNQAAAQMPPLADTLASSLAPGVQRRTLELMTRAWAGRATPNDADCLADIIVDSHQLRSLPSSSGRSPFNSSRLSAPVISQYPSELLIWNLSGQPWTDTYASLCRTALLHPVHPGYPLPDPSPLTVWSQWRPEWPVASDEATLTKWAWSQLHEMNQATPERALSIADRLPSPADRFAFAARCRRTDLLVTWCRDPSLLTLVNSSTLMTAVGAFTLPSAAPLPEGPSANALMAVTTELARRMALHPLDLIRKSSVFYQLAPATIREAAKALPLTPFPPEEPGFSLLDFVRRSSDNSQPRPSQPHPFFGLQVCPSVERFRCIAAWLRLPPTDFRSHSRPPGLPALALLLGNDDAYPYTSGIRPQEFLDSLADFQTTHPLKRQILRWNEIARSLNLERNLREQHLSMRPGRPGNNNFLKAALILAEEESSSLPWQFLRASLEEIPATRASLIAAAKARSPLTAGADSGPAPAAPATPPPATAPEPQIATPAAIASKFMTLITDPEVRSQLSPVGALSLAYSRGEHHPFFRLIPRISPETSKEAAKLLINEKDPLAARMAVFLATPPFHESRELASQLLARAVASFPDDTELLLAFAADNPGKAPEISPARRAAFIRGLASLDSTFQPRQSTDSPSEDGTAWCRITDAGPSPDADTVRAILAYTERTRTAYLPQKWIASMQSLLERRPLTDQLSTAEIRAAAVAVVTFKSPWKPGQGDPKSWLPFVHHLDHSGCSEAAIAAAEAILSNQSGDLTHEGRPSTPWDRSASSAPISRDSDGWKFIRIAARHDPAALALRLQAIARSRPDDERAAFVALIATGCARPLTAEDTSLTNLSPTCRQRVLRFATWLLPPDRLNRALAFDAWEADARATFTSDSSNTKFFIDEFDQPVFFKACAALDKLADAGATDAARRLLTLHNALLPALVRNSSFDNGYVSIMQRLLRLGSPEDTKTFRSLVTKRLMESPPNRLPSSLAVALQLEMMDPSSSPSPEVDQLVTSTLEAAAAADPSTLTKPDGPLGTIAHLAAGHPRWHALLRKVLTSQPQLARSAHRPNPWLAIATLFAQLDSNSLIPNVTITFSPSPSALDQGTLHWSFHGLKPPPLSDAEIRRADDPLDLSWQSVASQLAGRFNALALVSDHLNPTSERVAAEITPLPASGSLPLTNLPASASLRLVLIRNDAPRSFVASPPVLHDARPAFIDSSRPPAPDSTHPLGWQLLTAPAPLTATQWQINRNGPASSSWPDDLALLLLDDSNQVCAIASLALDAPRDPSGPASSASKVIALHQFTTDPISSQGTSSLRVTGPPHRIALAQQALLHSTRTHESPFPPPPTRYTIEESPPTPAIAIAGRYDILRAWHLPASHQGYSDSISDPIIRPAPPEAAWFSADQLFLLDLTKDSPPRTLKLNLPPDARLATMFWSGPFIHVSFVNNSNSKPFSTLLTVKADLSDQAVSRHNFSSPVSIHSLDSVGIRDVWYISSDNIFLGILDASGRLILTPPADPGATPAPDPLILHPSHALSASSFACYSPRKTSASQQFKIVDWSDGSIRIRDVDKLPPPLDHTTPTFDRTLAPHQGLLVNPFTNPPETWLCPLQLTSISPTISDLAIGLMESRDSAIQTIVLLRKSPAPK